jgi:hypothetical protein
MIITSEIADNFAAHSVLTMVPISSSEDIKIKEPLPTFEYTEDAALKGVAGNGEVK